MHLGAFWRVCASCRKSPSNTHAPTTTVLGHFVESERTRPFPIPPWHALRVPLDNNAPRWPGRRCAISAQSRLHPKGISHLEIAPRSLTCTQAIQRRYNLVEGAEHASEISTTPGMAMRRRTERECGFITHALTLTFCPEEPSVAPRPQAAEAIIGRAAHAPPTPTTATHGLAPRTTHSGAALGGLCAHTSVGGGR